MRPSIKTAMGGLASCGLNDDGVRDEYRGNDNETMRTNYDQNNERSEVK